MQLRHESPIDRLTRLYSDSLHRMPLEDKLLAVIAIAKAMRIGLLDADNDPSITESLQAEVGATSHLGDVDDGVFDAIAALDDCTEFEAYDLLKRISSLAAIEFRELGV